MPFARSLLALFLAAAAASATDINVPWCKPETPYPTGQARVGDSVTFNWINDYHNVLIHPSGECFNGKDKTFLSEQSGVTYTFTDADVGTNMTFICSVSDHCIKGQMVVFEVLEAGAELAEDAATVYETLEPCGAMAPPAPVASPEPAAADDSAGTVAGGVATVLSAMVGVAGLLA